MSIRIGNVLHVVDSLGLGGAQTILKAYFEAYAGNPRLHLYALRSVPAEMPIDHPNVEVDRSPGRFSFAPLCVLRRIVRQRAIAVVHCHLFRAQVFGFLLKLLFLPEIALIFHEHGRVVGREGESRLEAFLFRQFLRCSWRHVDRFICISEHTRECLLEVLPGAADRITVVANPVPVKPAQGASIDRAAMRRMRGIADDAFVVGFAARLVERKGWADFLEAIARAARAIPAYFLLAGDGEDRLKAEARIRSLGLEGCGEALGCVDGMADFYACLDCFVMPSHWEPHGLCHLEAQAFGVPVVVTRVPGLRSTVHEDVDALLCEPGDARSLAMAIERLATDAELRKRIGAAGVANAARYSTENFSSSIDLVHAEATSHSRMRGAPQH